MIAKEIVENNWRYLGTRRRLSLNSDESCGSYSVADRLPVWCTSGFLLVRVSSALRERIESAGSALGEWAFKVP